MTNNFFLMFFAQAFCLGHTKYVTSVVEAEQCLVSASGDGSVRLWDPESGRQLSEVPCSDNLRVVQQLIYLKQYKTIACLLAGSTNLVYVSLEQDEERGFFLNASVTEQELPAPALAMCSYVGDLIVLLETEAKPLRVVSVDKKRDADCGLCLTTVNEELQRRWASLSAARKSQNDFFVNLTKMNSDNLEEEMVRKGKRIPAHIEKHTAKLLKQ